MRYLFPAIAFVLTAVAIGCGGATGNSVNPGDEAVVASAPELDPVDPTLIARPFTAEEIREEWVPGLRLLMRRSYPEETRIERWTVISADEEGAEIEFAAIAEDGSVSGEPSVVRSTWTELRDHASFPAAHSSRQWISRSTQLGDFEGWLYRVADPEKGTVQEFFFVPTLPGAPVHLRVLEGESMVFELEQTARLRPSTN